MDLNYLIPSNNKLNKFKERSDWPVIIIEGKPQKYDFNLETDRIIKHNGQWYIDPGLHFTDIVPISMELAGEMIKEGF